MFFLSAMIIAPGSCNTSFDPLACPITVEKITSPNLERERDLFERCIDSFCAVAEQQPLAQKFVSDAFSLDEQAYEMADPATMFFHALHEDEVVGYISCDFLPGYHIRIRQFAIDPVMFDSSLVKELLFAIFTAVPKAKMVTVCFPASCPDLAAVFEEIGFVRESEMDQSSNGLFWGYELKIHPKCKICNVLYADELWGDEDNQEDDTDSYWADPMGPLVEEFKNNSQARVAPQDLEDESFDVL